MYMHEHVHVVDPPRSLAASLAETKKELPLTQVHHGSRQSDSCENQRTLTNDKVCRLSRALAPWGVSLTEPFAGRVPQKKYWLQTVAPPAQAASWKDDHQGHQGNGSGERIATRVAGAGQDSPTRQGPER